MLAKVMIIQVSKQIRKPLSQERNKNLRGPEVFPALSKALDQSGIECLAGNISPISNHSHPLGCHQGPLFLSSQETIPFEPWSINHFLQKQERLRNYMSNSQMASVPHEDVISKRTHRRSQWFAFLQHHQGSLYQDESVPTQSKETAAYLGTICYGSHKPTERGHWATTRDSTSMKRTAKTVCIFTGR